MSRTIKWPLAQPMDRLILEDLKEMLDSGETIVYPTNTLYGMGASIFSKPGIERTLRLKKRPVDIPFIIMANEEQIREMCIVSEAGERFLESRDMRITAIFKASEKAPEHAVHQGTVAVRLPCSNLTKSLVDFSGPITSTSANVHGQDPASTCREAREQFGDSIPLFIDSGPAEGQATTLLDFTGPAPSIAREGALSAREARELYG